MEQKKFENMCGNFWNTEDLERWIKQGIDKKAIEEAEKFANDLAKTVTSSQLRKLFSTIRKIQYEISAAGATDDKLSPFLVSKILMIKPQVKYAAAKAGGNDGKMSKLSDFINSCIDFICNDKNVEKKRFSNFVMLFEAIVAYHKVHDKNNN